MFFSPIREPSLKIKEIDDNQSSIAPVLFQKYQVSLTDRCPVLSPIGFQNHVRYSYADRPRGDDAYGGWSDSSLNVAKGSREPAKNGHAKKRGHQRYQIREYRHCSGSLCACVCLHISLEIAIGTLLFKGNLQPVYLGFQFASEIFMRRLRRAV